jgi:hypothetical protein
MDIDKEILIQYIKLRMAMLEDMIKVNHQVCIMHSIF